MDEKLQENTEEKEPENSTEDNGDGVQPESTGLIDNANTAAKRLEKATEKAEVVVGRQEELEARRQLEGRAEAGKPTPVEEELSPLEYSKKVASGEADPLKEDGYI